MNWVLTGLILLLLAGYGLSRALSAGKVLGSVTVENVELGGMTPADAQAALTDLENTLGSVPAMFTVAGTRLELEPATVGLDLDQPAMVDKAMQVGRQGNPAGQFGWWLTHLFSTTRMPVEAAIDPPALETVLMAWDIEAISSPPFPGGVAIDGTTVEPVYPREGQQVDRQQAAALIVAQVSTLNRTTVDLPISIVQPRLTAADVDQGVRTAQLILAGPVTLLNGEREKRVTFTVEQLRAALRSEAGLNGIEFVMDPEIVGSTLAPLREQLEDPPVDARLEVDEEIVRVIPGRKGTVLDPASTAQQLLIAASSAARTGRLPIEEAVDPDVTTEELEALGIRHKVSQFTTYHACCQNRVTNIHLIADKVDGIIVPAGATFSLNEAAGQRSAEDGYLEDGAIVGGRLQEAIGGGVSQFATTFYNAVFWGGYEDITHKPHSWYFSRYPLGIEATISWPLPDVHFRNNTESAILIRTFYSNSSITVAFYSDNEGRILTGEQSSGSLHIGVAEEGGPNARVVKADISDPYNFRDPPPPLYMGDEAIVPPEQKEDQVPAQGFMVTVKRTITQGTNTRMDEWTVVYSPRQQIILVHPCQIEGSGVSCPTTTTGATTTSPPP
ncbi:MAG: VanW family protein [Actinomycetota bacterium]